MGLWAEAGFRVQAGFCLFSKYHPSRRRRRSKTTCRFTNGICHDGRHQTDEIKLRRSCISSRFDHFTSGPQGCRESLRQCPIIRTVQPHIEVKARCHRKASEPLLILYDRSCSGRPLSRSESFRTKGTHVAPTKLSPDVEAAATCSACDQEMVITRIKPILFSKGHEHLTLECRKCGSTKTITIRPS